MPTTRRGRGRWCVFFLMAVFLLSLRSRSAEKDGSDRIFVSVASYRDPHCPATLMSLFANASNPFLVDVGLVDQTRDEDTPCVAAARKLAVDVPRPQFIRWLEQRVQKLIVSAKDARGPAHARYLASQMYAGQSYFLMIDSHVALDPNWDRALIGQLRAIEDRTWPKAILSYHPRDAMNPAAQTRQLTLLCDTEFHPDWGVPIVFSRRHKLAADENACMRLGMAGHAFPQPFTCAGFLFARGELIREVPFSPDLRYVFHGEEIQLTIRAYANGWRSFRPCRTVITHRYERKDEPSVWKDLTEEEIEIQRQRSYLGLQAAFFLTEYNSSVLMAPNETAPTSLHVTREKMSDFWKFSHINPRTRTMDVSHWGCYR